MSKRILINGLKPNGECPAQRISDARARAAVADQYAVNSIREHGKADCHSCGRRVTVTRRFDDGRVGWSPWRYEPHTPPATQPNEL